MIRICAKIYTDHWKCVPEFFFIQMSEAVCGKMMKMFKNAPSYIIKKS